MKRVTRTIFVAIVQIGFSALISLGLLLAVNSSRASGPRELHVLTTNDIHGHYFDSTYVDDELVTSLQNISWYVDSVRTVAGSDNVLLIDAGDILQGDNASYYYNYVAVSEPHVYPRMAKYLGYDVVVVGNHDIETGHPVYDRVASQLKFLRLPFLAGNALKESGDPYFPEYKVIKKAGRKILVLGYTNANIKAWLNESLWCGMDFESLVPFVQERVDLISKKVKPDMVIVATHSGVGLGDGTMLESQGMDLFKSLKGVDILICAHDHRPCIEMGDGICLVNSGSSARNIGHVVIEPDGTTSVELIKVSTSRVDEKMLNKFHGDYLKVKAFTLREVGYLECVLDSRKSYGGMSDYVNLLHTVQLKATGADISLAAPLSYSTVINPGTLIYNDMFSIYSYENQLFTVRLSGSQIKNYLEYSYDLWIGGEDGHVLKIDNKPDPRTGSLRWSFVNRSYNFDSAAGLNYTVDATAPAGARINIVSLTDGTPFSEDNVYTVAMTSYRASGGGDLLVKGAQIPHGELESIVIEKYPEIRNLIYDFIQEHKTLTSELIGDSALIGHWNFIPESACQQIEKDLSLLF